MFEELIAALGRTLSRAGISYMIIGGQAVLLYGNPRMTKDIDVTLGVDVDHLGRVMEAAETMGLRAVPQDLQRFVQKTSVLPAVDPKSGIRVDFIFSFTPYERQAISRAKRVEVLNTRIMFAAVEDVIIHKIFAGRPRDLEDVRSIIVKNPHFDKEYVATWLRDFAEATERKDLMDVFKGVLP